MLIAFHKPYGVLSQFTSDGSANRPLSKFGLPPRVYALGRLDADSEGLLLLSDEPGLNSRLLEPAQGHPRTYWAQVEGIATEEGVAPLRVRVDLGDFVTKPAAVRVMAAPPSAGQLWPRTPPVRFRKNSPTSWLEIVITEGKNRQVRRMTAKVGLPTLRLIRVAIGSWRVDELAPGSWRVAQ